MSILLAVLILVVAPNRGAAWIQDDGLFLMMSWDAAHGYGFDKLLPQSPSYLFHAIFIKAGGVEYLHFRYLSYFFAFFASWLFFRGLLHNRQNSALLPVAIACTILIALDSIQNPNTLPMMFFLLGAGLYFHALNFQNSIRLIFIALAGTLLAVAGFMHAAAAIAIALTVLTLAYFDKNNRWGIILAFALASLALWGWYLYALAPASFFVQPAGHETGLSYLLKRVYKISIFYFKGAILYFLIFTFTKGPQTRRLLVTQFRASSVVTIFCALSLISYLADSQYEFPGWLWVAQLPGAIYTLLCFVVITEIGLATTTRRSSITHAPSASYRKSSSLSFWLTRSVKLIIRKARLSPTFRNYSISMLGIILIPASLAVGSNEAVIQKFAFVAGPALGIVIMSWYSRANASTIKLAHSNSSAWLLVLCVIALTYNHPTRTPVMATGRVELHSTPLRGIYESPRYADALAKLSEFYNKNKCGDKLFFSLDFTPLLNYIFQQSLQNGVGIVRPVMYFPGEKIRSLFRDSNGWCVIDITGVETQNEILSKENFDKREWVRQFIISNSDMSAVIHTPSSEYIGDIHMYARKQR